MLASHPRGYAIRSKEQLVGKNGSPIDVALEPWGRIEGTLRVGEKIGADERVSIGFIAKDDAQDRFVSQHLEATTDSQGRFTFEHVLPGAIRLSYSVNHSLGPRIL